jgi:hypothetical protein
VATFYVVHAIRDRQGHDAQQRSAGNPSIAIHRLSA